MNQLKINSPESNKVGCMMIVGFVLLFGIFGIFNYFENQKFIIHGKIVKANVTYIEFKSRYGMDISFTYVYAKKKYVNSSGLAIYSKSIYELVGTQRPILAIVDTLLPENAHLLMTRNDFEKYKIIPPDSVSWIFAYTSDN